MTGLVLCDDPATDAGAFRSAYARYLATSYRRFVALESELPMALRAAHARVVSLVQRALATDERHVLNCFASPTVGAPLRCLPLRNELSAFRTRIDDAAAAMMPHLLFEMGLRRLIGEADTLLWEHGAPRLASLAVGGR